MWPRSASSSRTADPVVPPARRRSSSRPRLGRPRGDRRPARRGADRRAAGRALAGRPPTHAGRLRGDGQPRRVRGRGSGRRAGRGRRRRSPRAALPPQGPRRGGTRCRSRPIRLASRRETASSGEERAGIPRDAPERASSAPPPQAGAGKRADPLRGQVRLPPARRHPPALRGARPPRCSMSSTELLAADGDDEGGAGRNHGARCSTSGRSRGGGARRGDGVCRRTDRGRNRRLTVRARPRVVRADRRPVPRRRRARRLAPPQPTSTLEPNGLSFLGDRVLHLYLPGSRSR